MYHFLVTSLFKYFAVALSFVSDHSAQNEEEEEEKSHDDVSCNMVSMCSDCVDSNLEETKSDLENKRVAYQLHHQQVFLDNEGYD